MTPPLWDHLAGCWTFDFVRRGCPCALFSVWLYVSDGLFGIPALSPFPPSGAPFEALGQVPNLLTMRFELDISLLAHQPLNYITVTETAAQIEDREYTVDDLKDVIFSRLGHSRTPFWMALPSSGDSRVWEAPYTCTLEDLALYYINSRCLRPIGYIHEYLRRDTPYPYRPFILLRHVFTMMPIGQLRLPLTAHPRLREIHPFS